MKIKFNSFLSSCLLLFVISFTSKAQITQVTGVSSSPQIEKFKDFSTKTLVQKSSNDSTNITEPSFHKYNKENINTIATNGNVMDYGPIIPIDSSLLLPSIDTVLTFTGQISNNRVIPAEPRGAVSPNFVITATNENITFQSKTGQVLNSIVDEVFWTNQDNTGSSISVVRTTPYYDKVSDRFVLFAQNGQNLSSISNILIAVSQTNNPTGTWSFYKFKTNTDNANISAHGIRLGYNKDWFLVSVYMANVYSNEAYENRTFVKSRIFCFKKQDLLTNQTVTPTIFDITDGNNSITPARVVDVTKSTISLLAIYDSDNALYSRYEFDGSNLAQPTIKTMIPISLGKINKWFSEPYSDNSLPQKNMYSKTNGIYGVSSLGLEIVETTTNLWATHSVYFSNTGLYNQNATFYSGIQWLKFDVKDEWIVDWGRLIDTTTVVYSNFRVSKNSFEFPALMVNNNEDIVITYCHFSPYIFPSVGYVVRLNGEPYFRKSKIYRDGKAKYYKTYSSAYNKWGFHNSIMLDPQNQKSYWLLGSYAETATTESRWGVAWAKVILP